MSYTASRNQDELRSRAEVQLKRLDLPPEVDLADIVRQVARATSKRIDVEPVGDKDWENVTGLVLLSGDSARGAARDAPGVHDPVLLDRRSWRDV